MYQQPIAGVIALRTLMAYGVSCSVIPSLRSEYVSISPENFHTLNEVFTSSGALQLWMPDLLKDSNFRQQLTSWCSDNGYYSLVRETDTAYAVDLKGNTFSHYLSQLKPNTRAKLFHRRSRLLEEGSVDRRNWWPDIGGFIAVLNQFHLQRWDKPCYHGENRQMIERLLTSLGDAGHYIDLSVMTLNNQPISAVLDIHYHKRIYNLQSGFDDRFGSRLSLGILHLGYQLEAAFNTDSDIYDFLIGRGKATAYKKELATMATDVESVLIVKPWYLNALYRINDWIKGHRLG